MAEGKVVATLKAGRDYDAPWVTLGADTPEELAVLVDRAGQAGLGAAVANAAKGFQGTYAVAGATGPVQQVGYEASPTPPVPTAAPPVAQPAAPAAPVQSAPPANPGMSCEHGPRVMRQGNKNGRNWTAYFCPLPQDTPGACAPIWG